MDALHHLYFHYMLISTMVRVTLVVYEPFIEPDSYFDCSHVGTNEVILTVTDVNGNQSTATATVTVEDDVAPVASAQLAIDLGC